MQAPDADKCSVEFFSVEVDSAMSGKGVATTGIGEDFSEFVAGERGNDLSLRILRDIRPLRPNASSRDS